ncbi:hypothetical protein PHYBLDRAFT_172282 [Phycomyces blakesleeanus NRRL 1555(-)]|uniref:Uncharacterized protein n=1 Tax=Phycomyces blakesleeanus (strain ATCC 8743b / DSM 1359 / FGSC 10004 / NBRC 33097 / NRRL 1555) TaxID=763407 RepID=A0A167L5N9_PHYB8|nr:hypothetical protein PHYBLDRAFT_172282 [Phycomyces blakesleeanus NRRL 1555(-)]OAD69649.1 hypothetical protein PHYBLDRAFT_172282 [Phycomyces blakesleeanus NRRL 1555(-)]|eukprot:XP_018287689.1 hypothetical protein PHYBLDRAFT_172282 [Phycomyces blakesleeanus NRRL 1555(-)]
MRLVFRHKDNNAPESIDRCFIAIQSLKCLNIFTSKHKQTMVIDLYRTCNSGTFYCTFVRRSGYNKHTRVSGYDGVVWLTVSSKKNERHSQPIAALYQEILRKKKTNGEIDESKFETRWTSGVEKSRVHQRTRVFSTCMMMMVTGYTSIWLWLPYIDSIKVFFIRIRWWWWWWWWWYLSICDNAQRHQNSFSPMPQNGNLETKDLKLVYSDRNFQYTECASRQLLAIQFIDFFKVYLHF